MSSLESGDRAALQTRFSAGDGLHDACVRSLRRRQPAGHCLGLGVVLCAVAAFQRVQGGKNESRPKSASEPGKGSRTKVGSKPRDPGAETTKLRAPKLRMRLLEGGEAAIDICKVRIALCRCERLVEACAVDLALQVRAVAGRGRRCPLSPRVALRGSRRSKRILPCRTCGARKTNPSCRGVGSRSAVCAARPGLFDRFLPGSDVTLSGSACLDARKAGSMPRH